MRVIIHLGTAKTGSSSLQKFLSANSNVLADNGIAYLTSPIPKTKGHINSRSFATYCLAEGATDDHARALGITKPRERQAWRESFRREFAHRVRRVRQDFDTVIISSEHFHSRLFSEREVIRLYELLADQLSVNDLELIAYLRRQDLVAVSFYSTICRVGGTRRQILPIADAKDNYYNYYRFASRWASVFGKERLKLRIYERPLMRNGDIVDDFVKTMIPSILGTRLVRPESHNEALPAVAQETAMAFNRSFSRASDTLPRREVNKLRRSLIAQLETTHPGRPALPGRKDAEAFFRTFEQSNAKVAQEYFNQSQLFEEDFSRYPEDPEATQIDGQALEAIFSTLLRFLERKRTV